MFTYRAYGLCVESEIPLPELPVCDDRPVVTICQRPLAGTWLDGYDGGDYVCGEVEGPLRFLVEGGERITLDYDPGLVDESLVRTLLLGGLMATILRQRGFLVLHACGVAREGRAIAFVGDSGWGKSTLASFFCRHGFQLLSDDVLVIDLSGEAVRVVPGAPMVKLRPDAGQWLRADYDNLPNLHFESNKRLEDARTVYATEDAQLERLYILEGRGADHNEILPLHTQEKMVELLRHTRVTNLVRRSDYLGAHLRQCNQLVQHVPIVRLRRVVGLDGLPDLLTLIEKDAGFVSAVTEAA
jgi:hypothetical protein